LNAIHTNTLRENSIIYINTVKISFWFAAYQLLDLKNIIHGITRCERIKCLPIYQLDTIIADNFP
jgi:hypothetical protein